MPQGAQTPQTSSADPRPRVQRPTHYREADGSVGEPLAQMPAQALQSERTRNALSSFAGAQPASEARSVGQMLRSVYGPSRRDPTRPDLSAAAKDLDMSPRQLRRWVNGESTPQANNPRLQKLRRRLRTFTNSRAGRAQAVGPKPPTPPAGQTTVAIGGVQGVTSGNDDAYRDRMIEFDMTAEEYAELQQLWVEHGNAGMVDGLHALAHSNYYSKWHFQSIDTIQWGRPGPTPDRR